MSSPRLFALVFLWRSGQTVADYLSTLCVLAWTARRFVGHTFGRQAIPMTWDFGEMNPFADCQVIGRGVSLSQYSN